MIGKVVVFMCLWAVGRQGVLSVMADGLDPSDSMLLVFTGGNGAFKGGSHGF